MKKNSIALILALVMLLACLSACGQSKTQPTAEPTVEPTAEPTVEPSAEPTEETGGEESGEETHARYAAAYAKYPADTVVMTINGRDVTWGDYFYWLYTVASQMEYYYPTDSWNNELYSGMTYGGYVQLCVEDMLKQYWVIAEKAEEQGIELSDEDKAAIEEIRQSDIDNYGGGSEAGFETFLNEVFITPGLYDTMNTVSRYYDRMFEENFGENAAQLSDEDTLSYANDKGYLHCKHILLLTQKEDGSEMTVEEAEAQKQKAQEILDQLKACPGRDELLKTFDELMQLNSEDTGLPYYPDGYYFTEGDMVAAFEDASKALDEYGLSDIVESPYGYHIILRLPLDPDGLVDYEGSTLRYTVGSELYSNMTQEWFDAAEVVYEPGFEALDFDELFAQQ